MSFFRDEPTPDSTRAELARARMMHQSVMSPMQPPEDELGVSVPLSPIVLLRNDDVIVAVAGIEAFSTGFLVRVSALARQADGPGHRQRFGGMQPRGDPGAVRLGVLYGDGRRGDNASMPDPNTALNSSDRILIVPRGGHGGNRRFDQMFWIRPLPPQGRLTFIAQWRDAGLDEQQHEMDAEPILTAAARVAAMWPRDPTPVVQPTPYDLEAALLSALTRQLVGIEGVRIRGVLLDGHHPDTNLLITFDALAPAAVGQELRVAIWEAGHDASLVGRSPMEAGTAIASRLRDAVA